MKAPNPWITYRTRFLVKAKQLTTSLAFTDVLGRQHSGRKGDYLVESSDGVLRIAPRQIFEDIYVPIADGQDDATEQPRMPRQYEILSQDAVDDQEAGRGSLASGELSRRQRDPALALPAHLTRKSPQPYRDRRNSSPGIRSL
jgi:hypothetical protein